MNNNWQLPRKKPCEICGKEELISNRKMLILKAYTNGMYPFMVCPHL